MRWIPPCRPEARRKVEAAATLVAQTISQQEGEENDHGL